jgi:hypothetical protein|nr:MAG TPA_asm: Protein of unknown function (DUF2442) [Caudoviricetes sp.]
MFHKVATVSPCSGFSLNVEFTDGTKKRYDVSRLFDKWPVFQALKENGLFDAVKVDPGGYGVSWNDSLDLSCDELYYN